MKELEFVRLGHKIVCDLQCLQPVKVLKIVSTWLQALIKNQIKHVALRCFVKTSEKVKEMPCRFSPVD